MLKGSLVAIVTPMNEQGAVDLNALKNLVEWHIENGTHGIIAVGTTGESATLSIDEHVRVISEVVKQSKGRVPVIAGTGANSTEEAIELTHAAEKVGANYSLSVVPYYNKPTQEGLYRHFRTIAEATALPMILYNVPGRTVADMQNETTLRLAEIPNIVGIKDATGDLGRNCDLILRSPENFAIYTGDDPSALAFLLCGGDGVISVTANVAPKDMAQMCEAAFAKNIDEARSINNRLQALHRDLFCEANPIPVKWALERMGKIGSTIRLPLTRLSDHQHGKVEQALKLAKIL